jgi:hypothetical protein
VLPFFPASYPDESLYSLMARYHRLSGNIDDRQSLKELVGNHTHVITSHLPSMVGALASSLPIGGKSAKELVVEHTLYPYFACFLSPEGKNAAVAAMIGDNAGGLKMRIGLVPSRIGGCNTYRYCCACMREESEHGQAYWHRVHQLPGVWLCPHHALPLSEVDPSFIALKRHRLLLPDLNAVRSSARPVIISTIHIPGLAALAQLSADALRVSADNNSLGGWNLAYRGLAAEMGLIKANGRIDIHALGRHVARCISLLPNTNEFSFLDHCDPLRWVLRLLRKPKPHATHPLKHLLLLHCLGGSFQAQTTHTAQGHSTATGTLLPRSESSEKAGRIDRSLLSDYILQRGYTLSRCAGELGLCTTTVRVEAARLGLPVRAKPKKLRRALIDEIEESLKAGESVTEVSVKHGLSLSSIYRILRMSTETLFARRAATIERETANRRERLVRESETTSIRKCADYSWLRRNDKRWLNEYVASSSTRRRLIAKPYVNWAERDAALASAVRRCVEHLQQLEGKPVWMSRATIGRLLKSAKAFERYVDLLPQTHQNLAELAESFDEWQCRRLLWAREELSRQHLPLARWRILRQAGIRRMVTSEPVDGECKLIFLKLI